ncbi:uncharacterized protein LOC108624595 isoform X3 [Ceratina calcarata]|uniref:Uncharacterized protein LOC108624595 isoform X3 n=1 Tax=Ceratina calcarata TaxID=156304 RepID=A0AAJ7WAC3_9HYME|nr:uncharacterized protein LOC108624595 isoform X3 [Ceratina calcarata]
MYECFNMAYQDNASALQLHIKINSENLLPAPQKYNAGSLRIPADPSWPKIPQRKLIDDVGDAIEPPCIVTLTGTPRRSRTVVQTPLNQSPKSTLTKDSAYSSYHNQRTTSSMQTLKRVPGYVDPRFKKVTNVKRNQVTSTDSFQKESNRVNSTMSAQHLHREEIRTQTRAEMCREEEKLGSTQNHREENRFNVNREPILEPNCSTNNSESRKCDNIPDSGVKEKSNVSKSMLTNANTQVDIAALPVQENNGQLFFVLDKKLQNAIHVDTISVPKDYVNQCYNVQVPVLAYQKIPVQVSPTGASNVIQQCVNSECNNLNETQLTKQTERKQETINNPHSGNNIAENSVCETRKQQESSDSEYYVPNINKKRMQNNVLQRLKVNKCETSGEETTDSEFVARIVQKRVNKINPDTVHGDNKTTVQNYAQINLLSKENEYLQSVPCQDQNQSSFNYKTATCETKGKNKSEQNLSCARNECTRKLCRSSEPYITFKQKKASARFSRKAKSYFQKNSHSALADSDYTLAWPNCQYGKCKRNQAHKFNHKVKKIGHLNPVSVHECNAQTDNARFVGQYYARDNEQDSCQEMAKSSSKTYLQREHCKCDVSARSNIDDNCERTKGISPKTQELLNRSYWEYYNKLRHKIQNPSSIDRQYARHLTMDPLEKGKRAKISDDKDFRSQLKINPELHTLEQCTALSTMINKALDSNPDIVQTKLHTMEDSPLNHKVSSRNANAKRVPNLTDDDILKMGRDENKTTDKQFLELKSISKFIVLFVDRSGHDQTIVRCYNPIFLFSILRWYDVYSGNIFTDAVRLLLLRRERQLRQSKLPGTGSGLHFVVVQRSVRRCLRRCKANFFLPSKIINEISIIDLIELITVRYSISFLASM